ncbi:MAG TPA: hydroxyacid dehydrogenase [Candidatus Eisenbacteria bacterium]|nr:hydroxyacid dehydrogenase [Candidatus Eisenbacteria bacterium]
MDKPVACFLMRADVAEEVYGARERAAVARLASIAGDVTKAEVILASWGCPVMNAGFLDTAPRLRLVLYAAGSVRAFVTEALWERGIRVSSAAALNAAFVAEYTLAAILFSLKHGWRLVREPGGSRSQLPGAFGATVGLVSLGAVGRLVRKMLRPHQLKVVAYDPFLTADEARRLGVRLVDLAQLFRISDVVSVHTPLLPETRGMITGVLIESMRPGATLINTARGAIVREVEMVAVLERRPDLQAVLDVTDPEPPVPGSPLLRLPNVARTPHIAGAIGPERRRLGKGMVEELRRYVRGETLRWEVTREQVEHMATP